MMTTMTIAKMMTPRIPDEFPEADVFCRANSIANSALSMLAVTAIAAPGRRSTAA